MHTARTTRIRRIAVAVTTAAVLPLSLAACSEESKDKASDSAAASSEGSGDGSADSGSGSKADGSMPAGDRPFGPACSTVPESGAGSFQGMAQDPVATAASNNPALSTLVGAVKKAGLVDTLNSAKNITVFAPTNDAFAKIPKADLNKVLNDKAMLTKVLTNHVVGEKVTPKKMENASYETLAKTKLTTAGSGTSYKVNDTANVVCGNVRTSNATVHIVDTVLMPG
ncbi:fasciclin domain-containing protein [Streptomyces sp. NPDC047108]|uniref:fasciclin domain-containing protein n=1 Tax=Streptomyces sp. NPDC047108 TaxID=3155025 RepID=UPI0033E909F0